MDNHVWGKVIDHLRDQRIILKHPFGHGEMRVLQQHLMAPLFQRDVIVICHAVKPVDPKAFDEQKLGEMESDEAGGAGDKDFSHGCGSCSFLASA